MFPDLQIVQKSALKCHNIVKMCMVFIRLHMPFFNLSKFHLWTRLSGQVTRGEYRNYLEPITRTTH